ELADQPRERLEGAQILPRALSNRRRLEPVGGPQHEAGQILHGGERSRGLAHELERRQRVPVAEAHGLLLGALAGLDRASAQPTLDPVDAGPREPGVGRAKEAVQVAAVAVLPGKAKEGEQRLPELRLVESDPALDRVRDAERAERRLQRGAVALDARTDERDLLRTC